MIVLTKRCWDHLLTLIQCGDTFYFFLRVSSGETERIKQFSTSESTPTKGVWESQEPEAQRHQVSCSRSPSQQLAGFKQSVCPVKAYRITSLICLRHRAGVIQVLCERSRLWQPWRCVTQLSSRENLPEVYSQLCLGL